MQVRALVAVIAIGLPFLASAGPNMGALGGAGQAMQDWAAREQDADNQKELIQKQHELEMQRMRYQFELQQRAQAAEFQHQEVARKTAQEQEKARVMASESARLDAIRKEAEETERSNQYLDRQHPGWRELVNSKPFRKWEESLPYEERREFQVSNNVYYVSSMISRYKDTIKRVPGTRLAK